MDYTVSELKGRKALVTGAGRGAGQGIAEALARQGVDLILLDLDEETLSQVLAEVSEHGIEAEGIVCDAASEADVKSAFERAEAKFGALDILVNTVAWIDPHCLIEEMPFENWQRAMRVNTDSVFLCSKHAIPLLRKNDEALIINISSINGTRGFPYRAPYGASKAAVINLTQTLAMELLADGIRVNSLVPGAITGERARILKERMIEKGILPAVDEDDPGNVLRHAKWMDPIDVGNHVVYLASDAGRFVNGQALWLGDGPRTGAQTYFS